MMRTVNGTNRPIRDSIAACDDVLPPPIPGVRHVRVPRLCIVIADDELRARVDRIFHWPMIVLAFLVLPLLAVELFYLDRFPEAERNWVGLLCWIGFTLIWLAFFIEFVIKIAIAECRVEYCRRNWLDLIILVVPALRPLRLTSLVRTSRIFKLRGVGMKAFRYGLALIVGLEAAEPWLQKIGIRKSKQRKDPDRMTRYELMDEVKRLRRVNDQWKAWHEAEQEYLKVIDRVPFQKSAPDE
jgi:hypothetical protein